MLTTRIAGLFHGRVHYAWVVLIVVFVGMLAGVGVRAAPGVSTRFSRYSVAPTRTQPGPLPVMMYYHGGGFVIADTKVFIRSCLRWPFLYDRVAAARYFGSRPARFGVPAVLLTPVSP